MSRLSPFACVSATRLRPVLVSTVVFLSGLFLSTPNTRANCGPTLAEITVDGRFEDWANVLRNPANLGVDAFGNIPPCGSTGDRDCPFGAALDLRRFATTWDGDFLYVFIERFGRLATGDERYYHLWIDRDDEQVFDAAAGSAEDERDFVIGFEVLSEGTPIQDDLDVRLYRLRPDRSYPLVDESDRSCGVTGDQPCADGHFPGDEDGDFDEFFNYADCTDNRCISTDGKRIEFALRWTHLDMEPGQPFAYHLSSADTEWPSNDDYEGMATWDNAGGLGGGPGTLGFDCHELVPPSNTFGLPGSVVYHAHELVNLGNRDGRFDWVLRSSEGWALSLWHDVDGDGLPSAADVLLCLDAEGDGDFSGSGDRVEPDGDSNGDGIPDSGVLAGARTGTLGEALPILLGVEVPAGVTGPLTENSTIEAVGQDGSIALVVDKTRVGRLVARDDQGTTAAPGVSVPYAHRVWNSSPADDLVSVEVSSSELWTTALLLDDDCDGLGEGPADARLLLPAGEEQCLVLEVDVPEDAELGRVDTTVVIFSSGAAPGTTAFVVDTTTVAEPVVLAPSYTVAEGRARHAGPDTAAFFAHRLTNNTASEASYFLSHTSSEGLSGTFLSDPDCDGSPLDGVPMPLEVGPLAPFGDSTCLVLRIDVDDRPVDTVDASTGVAVERGGSDSADVLDETIVSRVVTFRDPLRVFGSTDFQPCARVHGGGFGLAPNRVDRFLFWWEDPSGRLMSSEVTSSGPDGRSDGDFVLPLDAEPGAWTLRLFRCPDRYDPDGTCPGLEVEVDSIVFAVGFDTGIEELVTDEESYDIDASLVRVVTRLRNVGDQALIGSRLEHVVLTPDRSLYLDASGFFEPYTGVELTRGRDLPTVAAGEVLNDGFALLDVGFPVEGPDYTVECRWLVECGASVASSTTSFTVVEPCTEEADPADTLRGSPDGFTWEGHVAAMDYPVLRGTIPAMRGMGVRGPEPYDHECLLVASEPSFEDTDPFPIKEAGYYYLVTARTQCGLVMAAYGVGSDGRLRPTVPCP
ncbi:MAG: hypothetical protein AAF533_02820 [Acidobacteriota bacterium]